MAVSGTRMWRALAAGIALLAAAAPADAAVDFEISQRLGALNGNTTYRIGGFLSTPSGSGYVNSPLSELKFPLEVWTASVAGALRVTLPSAVDFLGGFLGAAVVLEGEYGKSLSQDAGLMRDSDWDNQDFPNLKTIYSESNTALTASFSDIRLRLQPVWRVDTFSGYLGFGGGYFRQRLNFEVSNVVQTSVDPKMNVSADGLVGTYEVTYVIPYLEFSGGVRFGDPEELSGGIDVRLGLSSWAKAEDRDDHILRKKMMNGSCDGSALLLGLRGHVSLTTWFFITAGVSYITIDTEGTQTQRPYAATGEGPPGPIVTIDEKVFSSQMLFDVGLGLAF